MEQAICDGKINIADFKDDESAELKHFDVGNAQMQK